MTRAPVIVGAGTANTIKDMFGDRGFMGFSLVELSTDQKKERKDAGKERADYIVVDNSSGREVAAIKINWLKLQATLTTGEPNGSGFVRALNALGDKLNFSEQIPREYKEEHYSFDGKQYGDVQKALGARGYGIDGSNVKDPQGHVVGSIDFQRNEFNPDSIAGATISTSQSDLNTILLTLQAPSVRQKQK